MVQSGSRKWRITSDEVPAHSQPVDSLPTPESTANEIGRYGTLEGSGFLSSNTAQNGASFTTGFTYDRTAIDRLVDIIAESHEYDATDAPLSYIDVQSRTFTFSDAKPGYQINRTQLREDILAALDAGAYDRVITPQGRA